MAETKVRTLTTLHQRMTISPHICRECGQPLDTARTIKYGGLVLDKAGPVARIGPAVHKLRPMEFTILWRLVQKQGGLAPSWWLCQTDEDEITDQSLKVHICMIRRKTGLRIHNVWGQGYYLDRAEEIFKGTDKDHTSTEEEKLRRQAMREEQERIRGEQIQRALNRH